MESEDLPRYVVEIVGGVTNTRDDNVDVCVYFEDGSRYGATFFTVQNVQNLMTKYRETGECASGAYFWASSCILVNEITEATIQATVANLLRDREFKSAFCNLDNTMPPATC